jgi:hypothetical protein
VSNPTQIEARMRKRGRWLCSAGWGVFALSLLLPSVDIFGWTAGWICLMTVFQIAWGLPGDFSGAGLYYAGFAVANVALIASPLLLRLFRGDLRWLRRCALVLAGATLYTSSYLLLSLPGGWTTVGNLHVGYYAWLLSFVMVTVGALHLSIRRPKTTVNLRPHSMVRTREEMEALRELEDYLSGIERPKSEEARPAGEPAVEAIGRELVGVG